MASNPMPSAAQPFVRRETGIITTPWQRWLQALVADRGNSVVWSNAADLGYQNGWLDGDPNRPAQYGSDGSGQVYLRGTLGSGVIGSGAFTLPASFCPMVNRRMPVDSNGAFGTVRVQSNGSVVPSVGSNVIVFLDGIVFSVN